ncbi:MAG TPA: adenine phosphoribosyltransferase [Thermoanaerobaculia bacterium]|nr:adenine phosphoribosyltransferase [Thermoanaerobaculia bacterium]
MNAADFRSLIRDVPDFPTPGILFRDITPLLASPAAFEAAVGAMAEPFRGSPPEKVLGIEARGFMFGAAIARELGIGFVPVRKPGKLPRQTLRVSYGLEYGKDSLEIHTDACRKGERVLIVDDVLATGGTAQAAGELADRLGAEVAGMAFFIELEALKGRSRLASRRLHSVLLL